MKKLSILEIVAIPAIVALTIVIKMPFSTIPHLEITTAFFIAMVILLKRHLGLYYLILFLIADSLLMQKGNLAYIANNIVMWIGVFGLVQIIKSIKSFRPVTLFATGVISVMWQTFISFWLLSIIAPTPGFPFSLEALKIAWSLDFLSGHPIITGALAVTMYFAFMDIIKMTKIREVFDKA